MSTVTVTPGDLITFDPSDKRVIVFDFDTTNLATSVLMTTYAITVEALKQADVLASLTYDNDALVTGSRKVTARFLATTANRGDKYRVSCKAVTNESPVQWKEYSIYIQIEDH